jgi:hypothetical protein
MIYKPFKFTLISENLDAQAATVSGKMLTDIEPNVHTVQRCLAVCGDKFLGVNRGLAPKFDIREIAKLSSIDLERFLDGQFTDFSVEICKVEKSWTVTDSLYVAAINDLRYKFG